jgi:Dynein heavy chain C-terminal domain
MLPTNTKNWYPEVTTDRLWPQVPPPFNLEAVMRAKAGDPSALHVVLFQEVERYNALLVRVRRSCAELLKGIQGLVVMSAGTRLEHGWSFPILPWLVAHGAWETLGNLDSTGF